VDIDDIVRERFDVFVFLAMKEYLKGTESHKGRREPSHDCTILGFEVAIIKLIPKDFCFATYMKENKFINKTDKIT